MKNEGKDMDQIAKELGISKSSVNQALDRAELSLPDDLKEANPSIISETRGLDKSIRIKIIRDAVQSDLNRTKVRDIVNKIKNETR